MVLRLPANPIDLTSAEFIADPYPAYVRLRNELPVCWDERIGHWVVSRYEDVHSLLRDKRLSSDQLSDMMNRLTPEEQLAAAPLREILTNRLVLSDDPAHHRIRALMQLAFTPRRVELMRPKIQAIADELLDSMMSRGRAELIAEYADPLPARVIAAMIGLPAEDGPRFKTWTDDIYAFFGYSALPVGERARRGTASAVQLRAYLADLFARLRRQPRDDLLSAMVAAEENGERLLEIELFSNVVGLINASHETTTNLIGNTVLALLGHPEEWRRFQAAPAETAAIIEEGLRYDAPVQFLQRRVLEELRVGDRIIPAGDRILLAIGAANRDPAVFEDPDRFDSSRDDVKHLAFGGGKHFCLGAALGRLEGQLALEALGRRLPGLRLVEGTREWRQFPVFRGLRRLPVEF